MARHICRQCGWVDTTARGLSQHIKDAHMTPRKVGVAPVAAPSNNGPAVIAEFTAEEATWLTETLERQMVAGMNLVQLTHDDKINPSRATLEKVIAHVELVRGIRKKLEQK